MKSKYKKEKNSIINYLILTISLVFFFMCDAKAADTFTFQYTGEYQKWVVPQSGMYKLEVWGAQGGYRSNSGYGGKGGYARGEVYLKKGQELFIYVGGSGKTHKGWNGGGKHSYGSTLYGGGASDIRLTAGAWNNAASLKSRFIVGGGGGSDGAANKPGGAGGVTGGNGSGCGTGGDGATLTGAGAYRSAFGKGGSGTKGANGYAGGGGGGWYGGGGASPDSSADDDKGGGGGSSFVLNAKTAYALPSGYSAPFFYILNNIHKPCSVP